MITTDHLCFRYFNQLLSVCWLFHYSFLLIQLDNGVELFVLRTNNTSLIRFCLSDVSNDQYDQPSEWAPMVPRISLKVTTVINALQVTLNGFQKIQEGKLDPTLRQNFAYGKNSNSQTVIFCQVVLPLFSFGIQTK